LLGVQVKSQRVKENIRLAVTLPVSGVPFVTRFIDGVATGTGSGAVADGVFDGTLTTLGAGLAQWPNAKPGALKGVRRVGDLRVTAAYSFLTELLPFVDASELHTRFDYRKSWSDKDNRPHAMAVIPAFLNPADPRMRWEGLSEDMNGLGLTHFVGMSGIEDRRNMIAAELPRSDPRAGIFGYDEVAKFSDITDGTTNTFCLGEVRSGCNVTVQTKGWWNPYANYFTTTVPMNFDSCTQDVPTYETVPGTAGCASWAAEDAAWGFKSFHAGGAQFLMCDGSVRFVSENLQWLTYQKLGDRRDNQTLGDF
jgi:prepilin-type processing-associated H-X9-DG protein